MRIFILFLLCQKYKNMHVKVWKHKNDDNGYEMILI